MVKLNSELLDQQLAAEAPMAEAGIPVSSSRDDGTDNTRQYRQHLQALAISIHNLTAFGSAQLKTVLI